MEEADNKWKIKRDISVADILSFLSAALAVVYAYTTLDKRVTLVEAALVETKTESKRQETAFFQLQANIERKLDKVDEKIDRLMQRQK